VNMTLKDGNISIADLAMELDPELDPILLVEFVQHIIKSDRDFPMFRDFKGYYGRYVSKVNVDTELWGVDANHIRSLWQIGLEMQDEAK
jgi:hypothetical protein